MPALSNIKVLDLTRVLAGPWATQMLADLGADVVKVERPGVGDETRHWGPPYFSDGDYQQSAYFLCANRNKRSIALDMAEADELAIIKRLANEADIVIENFKVGGLKKYGLDYSTLSADNPRLIYCSITGFGQDGPYAHHAGYDFMIQGMGGLMSVTGKSDEEGGEPTKVGVALADVLTGLYVSNAVLAALVAREQRGEGQYIDISLLDVSVATLANQATNFLVSGLVPQRMGNAHPNIVPYQVFATENGHIIIAIGNDTQFAQFAALIDRDDLRGDNRFKTNQQRVANRDLLISEISQTILQKTTEQWLALFNNNNIPCGPINNIEQVFNNPQIIHRGMQLNQDGVPGVANPIRFSKTPNRTSVRPPLLNEHRDAILSDWLK